jgi:hypothetical protein
MDTAFAYKLLEREGVVWKWDYGMAIKMEPVARVPAMELFHIDEPSSGHLFAPELLAWRLSEFWWF